MCSDSPLHRITAWTAILGYVLVASGLPLPLGTVSPVESNSPAAKRLAGKDRSKPFPCMDKPCGCASAEQCFSNCCCNTPAELLAWAQAHRVEPGVLVSLKRRVAFDTECQAGGCCADSSSFRSSGSDHRTHCESDSFEVCSEYRYLAAHATEDDQPADDQPEEQAEVISVDVVVLQAMLACSGMLKQWLVIGSSLPPLRVVCIVVPVSPCAVVAVFDTNACGERSAPDAPPPRA